jgi:hypothetical protein
MEVVVSQLSHDLHQMHRRGECVYTIYERTQNITIVLRNN